MGYIRGYNPLILTFDPNILGHPSSFREGKVTAFFFLLVLLQRHRASPPSSSIHLLQKSKKPTKTEGLREQVVEDSKWLCKKKSLKKCPSRKIEIYLFQ